MMQKCLLLFIASFFTAYTYAQGDFLLLKKRNKTIQTFYTGYYITFRTKSKEWISGYINTMANDTLHLKPFELVRYINGWGIPAVDTLWHNKKKIAVKDIDAFERLDQSVNYIKDGTILQVIGAGYILLNVINTWSSGDQLFDNNNGTKLAIAAAVFAVGTLMHQSRNPYLQVGRKYRLQYVNLTPDTSNTLIKDSLNKNTH